MRSSRLWANLLGCENTVIENVDWREEDPGLPVKFGPCSNAEYDPEPLSPVVTEIIRRARHEERLARAA